MTTTTKYITPRELAARLNVADVTLRKWRMKGTGPKYYKLGNARNSDVRYKLSDVEDWEKSNEYEPLQ